MTRILFFATFLFSVNSHAQLNFRCVFGEVYHQFGAPSGFSLEVDSIDTSGTDYSSFIMTPVETLNFKGPVVDQMQADSSHTMFATSSTDPSRGRSSYEFFGTFAGDRSDQPKLIRLKMERSQHFAGFYDAELRLGALRDSDLVYSYPLRFECSTY